MLQALGRVKFQQFAAFANTPFDTFQVFGIAVAQLRRLTGNCLGFSGIFIEFPFHAGGGLFFPLARAPPGAPGHSFQAVDTSQLFGFGRVNGHKRRCKPFLFQGLNVLGNALLGDIELAANLPLLHALQIHSCDAFAALENLKPLLGISTSHICTSLSP